MAYYKHEKKLLCAHSSKLIPTPEAPLVDSTYKMYSQKTTHSAFSRIDLAYFIPGSSGNNWGGERIGFEGEYMNSPYKYHKPIEPSEEWSDSYTWGVCMSQRQFWIHQSAIFPTELQVNWAIFWIITEPWDHSHVFYLSPSCSIPAAQTSPLWVHSFDHPVLILTHPRRETILCHHRSYSNAHTHMHTHILDQEKLQCLFNINILQSYL